MGICSGAGDTHISLQPQSVHSLVRSPEQKYDTEPTSVKMRKIKETQITPILIFFAAEQSWAQTCAGHYHFQKCILNSPMVKAPKV